MIWTNKHKTGGSHLCGAVMCGGAMVILMVSLGGSLLEDGAGGGTYHI